MSRMPSHLFGRARGWLPPWIFLLTLLITGFGCERGSQGTKTASSRNEWSLFTDPGARVSVETSGFKTDQPWAAPFLLAGWKGEGKLRWSTRPRSELTLWFQQPANRELQLRVKRYPAPTAMSEVEVLMNGYPLGRFTARQNWSDVRFTLPAQIQRKGWNRLLFRPARREDWIRDPHSAPGALMFGLRWVLVLGNGPTRPLPEQPPLVAIDSKDVDPRAPLWRISGPFQIDAWLAGQGEGLLKLAARVLAPEGLGDGVALVALVRRENQPFEVLGDIVFHTSADAEAESKLLAVPLEGGAEPLQLRIAGKPWGETWPEALSVEILSASVSWPSAAPAPNRRSPERETPPDPARHSTRPNVLIYLIDALRADRLGAYGNPEPLTPVLDRLADQSCVFTSALSTSAWTRTAVASLLTGLLPREHGALDRTQDIRQDAPSLVRLLEAEGYRTAAFVTNGNAALGGFRRGFQNFVFLEEKLTRRTIHLPAREIVPPVLEWIDRGSDPFFAYVHTCDPHAPYAPPSPWQRLTPEGTLEDVVTTDELARIRDSRIFPELPSLRRIQRLYDIGVRSNDAALGSLLHGLAERGLLERTMIVVTADHGEELGEHGGLEHGRSLYGEQLHVPLMIAMPEGKAHIASAPVSLVDVAPTILEVAGVRPPQALPGRSLLPRFSRAPGASRANQESDRLVIARLRLDSFDQTAVHWRRWKLVDYRLRERWDGKAWPRWELFDVEADPAESEDLAAVRPVTAGYLAALARREASAVDLPPAPTVTFDEEQQEILEALGYLR
jgi:arylsulfatase A-like enzyme